MSQSLQTRGSVSLAGRFKRRLGRTAIGGGLGIGVGLLISLAPTSALLVVGFVVGAWLINKMGKK